MYMKTTLLFLIGSLLLISCGQGKKTQEKLPFSNDYLIGEFSSQEGGVGELKIAKQGENYMLMQKMENNEWTKGEKLTAMPGQQLIEKFGKDWPGIISAALTSGMCDCYRVQPGESLGGITMGEQPGTEYFSRCFSDSYLYKVK